MVDRILLGKNEAGNEGLWVSKPGVDVVSFAGNTYLKSLGDWYGYQEEFDWTGAGGDQWVNTDPESSFVAFVGAAGGSSLPTSTTQDWLKRTPDGTIYYGAGLGDQILYTKDLVDGSGFPSGESFVGAEYPIVEMRIRRNYIYHDWSAISTGFGAGTGFPQTSSGDMQLFFENRVVGSTSDAVTWSGQASLNLPGTYKTYFPDSERPPGAMLPAFPNSSNWGPWKNIEWDMSTTTPWMDPFTHFGSSGPYTSQYRITQLRFDLVNDTATTGYGAHLPTFLLWNPQTQPLFEIDYVRVKKLGVPSNAGPEGNAREALIFDSDINHMGLVHQTGIVTIGTAKAWIDGTTSDHVVGHNIDNDANGYVSFPALDYIPLVLFQRIDENVGVTGVSYPGGEDEFSVCTQHWEDHRHPTYDMNTSESSYKGFDIKTVNKVDSSVYTSTLVSENFYFQTEEWGVIPGEQTLATVVSELPWLGDFSPGLGAVNLGTGNLFALRSERRGNSFSSMVQSFSETRTFAYARAKKDGFWLSCRNAIAQEGLEPVLNLAPVLPEEGSTTQGSAAYTSMTSNNDNGAWGMFHPALTLYDTGNGPQKFTEGLQLKWDTRTTANLALLDKVGVGDDGTSYDQYKWWPSFSCSGLPFNGILAFPNAPAPPDKFAASNWLYSYMKDATHIQAQYTTDGILKGDTGGFYPYRFQKNNIVFSPDGNPAIDEDTGRVSFSFGDQYNIKRLSSAGIFHPPGMVPSNKQAYDNKNISNLSEESPVIENQTAYIGGSMNTRDSPSVASYDATKPKPPKYKYWVLRVPVSIPEYTS